MDQRIIKLSDMLTSYSCDLQKGDRVLIDYEGEATRPLVCQLIKDCYKLGAKPYVTSRDSCLMPAKCCWAATRSSWSSSTIASFIR